MKKDVLKKVGVASLALSMAVGTAGDLAAVVVNADDAKAVAKAVEGIGSVVNVSKDGSDVILEMTSGAKLGFRFLQDNMFRLYLANAGDEDGLFAEPAPNSKDHTAKMLATPDSDFINENKVDPRIEETDEAILVQTDKVTLEVKKENGLMKLMKADGTVVWEESEPLKTDGNKTIQTLKTDANEYFYGGGTQNGRFSHKGEKIRIVNENNWVDQGVASPNPFYWSTNGYGVVRHTWKQGEYDFGKTTKGQVTTTHNEKRYDAYYFVDDGAKALLGDYYDLTGKPTELPEYASYLGHLNCYNRDFWLEVPEGTSGAVKLGDKWYKESQSDNGGVKETLLGDANTTAQQIIEDHKAYDMPLGWFLPNDGYGCGYGQTDSQAGDIENLKNFSDYALENGVVTGLWTQSNLWPADPANPQKGERDITKEVEAGVSAVKTDVAWVGAGYSFGLNGISVAYDAIKGSTKKPNIVTLDGWAGTQRYGGIWSGDQYGGKWEYIRFHIPTYIGTALSGQPNIGCDMDGIFGGTKPIIQTRDFQWKTFSTYMLDMDGWGSNQKSPWALGGFATDINRAYLKLKAQLMPYHNTASHEATAKGGLPMIRAMFLEEENAYTLGKDTQYQYMWGDNFLVAPVYQETATDEAGNDIRNNIYLPGTTDIWVDYFTGKQYRGGQIVDGFDAPIWKLPVFVKNGSIIPMYAENNNPRAISDANPDGLDRSKRIVEFYPYGNTEFEAYEDDGITLGGAGTTTLYTSDVEGTTATLKANATDGSYTGMVKERDTEFVVNVSQKPTAVTGNVKGSDVTFTEVATLEEYEKAEGNVYFYDEAPEVFVNKTATEGTSYEEVITPKLHVKSTEKVDVTEYDFTVTVEGFANEQDLGKDELNTELAAPAIDTENAVITDNSIDFTWNAIDGAETYDVMVDGVLHRLVTDTAYRHDALNFATAHTYQVRAVNHDGFSEWSEEVTLVTEDDPWRNNPTATVNWKGKVTFGKLNDGFDHNDDSGFQSQMEGTNHEMILDYGKAYQLDKFDYVPFSLGDGKIYAGLPTNINFYVSLDGQHWEKAYDGYENPFEYNLDTKTIKFEEGTVARYLKLEIGETGKDYFSANGLHLYKVDGTDGSYVGDVNKSGELEMDDLIFYENYMGVDVTDKDISYMHEVGADIDKNNMIDAYDLSYVARQLGNPVKDSASGVEGKLQLVPSKSGMIQPGEEITIQVLGSGLKNVNAFSLEIPVDDRFEVGKTGTSTVKTAFMRNFSKVRTHTDNSRDNYIAFTNVGDQSLLDGTGVVATFTVKAKKEFSWDTVATQAVIVGQDLSYKDANIDYTEVPELPETRRVLGKEIISGITFSNDVKENMDGSELWHQGNWKDILFDGDKSGNLAEFKWYLGNDNIAAEVKLPTDMNFEFNKAEDVTEVVVYNRTGGGNGTVTSIKAVAYAGETAYDLGTIEENLPVYTFAIPEEAGAIDRVVITPLTSTGTAGGTSTGSEENRMLSLREIEFVSDKTVAPAGIEFDADKAYTYVGGTAEVKAVVSPEFVSNPYYKITSSDESIAKVVEIPTTSGYIYVVNGVSAGTVTLTATARGDESVKATMEFEVKEGLDLEVLNEQIAAANALSGSLYTEETYADVMVIAKEAADYLTSEGASQAGVDEYAQRLMVAIANLEFRGSNDDQENASDDIKVPVIKNGTAMYVTSDADGDVKEHIIDGNRDTIWHSGYQSYHHLPVEAVIDLGDEYALQQINYLARQNSHNGHITKYQVEVSNDPAGTPLEELTFRPVVQGKFDNDGDWLDGYEDFLNIKFDTVNARYVKFIALETIPVNKYASIAELEFFGEAVNKANKAVLEATIERAAGLKAEHYTTDSWYNLEVALEEANALVNYTNATQADVDAAAEAVKAAIDNLEVLTYAVTVDGKVVQNAKYNSRVTITAPETPAGMKFAGWEVEGKVVSTKANYTFFVSGDVEFTSKFVEDETVIEETVEAVLTNAYLAKRADGKFDAKFVAQLNVPTGSTIKNAGLVWSSKEGTDLSLENKNLKPTYISKISTTNQFSVTIKGMPAGKSIRGRIFATVTDAEGNETVVYSAEETLTANN